MSAGGAIGRASAAGGDSAPSPSSSNARAALAVDPAQVPEAGGGAHAPRPGRSDETKSTMRSAGSCRVPGEASAKHGGVRLEQADPLMRWAKCGSGRRPTSPPPGSRSSEPTPDPDRILAGRPSCARITAATAAGPPDRRGRGRLFQSASQICRASARSSPEPLAGVHEARLRGSRPLKGYFTCPIGLRSPEHSRLASAATGRRSSITTARMRRVTASLYTARDVHVVGRCRRDRT